MRLRNPVERSVRGILLSNGCPIAANGFAAGRDRGASVAAARRLHSSFFCPKTSLWLSAALLPPVQKEPRFRLSSASPARLYSRDISRLETEDIAALSQARLDQEVKDGKTHNGWHGEPTVADTLTMGEVQVVKSGQPRPSGASLSLLRVEEPRVGITTTDKAAVESTEMPRDTHAQNADSKGPFDANTHKAREPQNHDARRKPTRSQSTTITTTPSHALQDRYDLLSFVNTDGIGPVKQYLQLYTDPYLRRYAQPDGPNIIVSNLHSDTSFPSRQELPLASDDISSKLALLISIRRRIPRRVTLTAIYEEYRNLPEPRMLHISATLRHALLEVMGTPAQRTARGMLRYFALVSDIKNSGLTLRRNEWNYALTLAGRYAGWTTKSELDSALQLWREMEHQTGIRGNEVTFNILFDVASKAGNFTLAEMLLTEMEHRRVKPDRYSHVGIINFFGFKMDSDGVRAAYREMVDAGEVVDTLVLNCVIHGLLKCGEEWAADDVYRRMMEGPADRPRTPQRDYASNKIISKVFKMFGRIGRREPELREHLRSQVSILPDHRTYRILIDHYALVLGDIARVVKLLDEMKIHSIAMDGRIYMALFKGFHKHGRRMGSSWSEQRLMGVYRALLQALESQDQPVYLTKWLALWVLRAFSKCSSRLTLFDVYLQLKRRADFDEGGMDLLENAATQLMGKE